MAIHKVFPVEEDNITPYNKRTLGNENVLELQGNSGNENAKNSQEVESQTKEEGYSFWAAHVYIWLILIIVVILTIGLSILLIYLRNTHLRN
uniref:Uncharacterized protein n=1 Tax=Acrobeloides nanus TaxID=290746 RepID=A0A914E826_9BILA